MTCIDPRGHGPFRVFPHPTWSALAIVVAATIAAHVAARAQGSDVKRYNPSEWTKGRSARSSPSPGRARPSTSPGLAPRTRTLPRARALPSGTSAKAYGDGPIPANTFLVINALAIPGMLLEIDVTAVVAR
jgi:hypothetical protein